MEEPILEGKECKYNGIHTWDCVILKMCALD